MFKLMIVDDDMLARIGMKSLIDWTAYGFEVIAAVDSGEQALELMKKNCPDVVFTDVVMHGMDGIELTKQIMQLYPNVLVVALSCYTDVDYVKRIIRMGAEDYLQKLSMRPEDVIALLRELTVKLNARNCVESNVDCFEEAQALKQLLVSRGENSGELIRAFGYADSTLIRMMVLRKTKGITGFSDALMEKTAAAICAMPMVKCYSTRYRDDVTAFICLDTNEKELVSRLEDILIRHSGQQGALSIGISQSFYDKTAVYHHFCKAGEAGLSSFLHPDKRVFVYRHEDKQKIDTICTKCENMLKSLDEFDLATVLSQTEELTVMMEGLETQPVLCRQMFTSFFSRLMRSAVSCGVETDTVGFNAISLDSISTIKQAKETFIGQVRNISAMVSHMPSHYRMEIRRAIDYIHIHYASEITLSAVASYVAMSESHLSSLFKKETGKGLINYIEEYRIAQAVRLMSEKREPLFLIAQQVGYQNVNYFSRVFKKVRGETPSSHMGRQKIVK